MRIFAISDLHTDFPENRRRLDALPAGEHRRDALIVAGDVADSLDTLSETLGFLRGRFGEVFFVPGNHELWVRGESRDSLQKLSAVLALCDALGVRTRPARFAGAWVVPLLSWYHESFDVEGAAAAEELEAWADFYFCRWPGGAGRLDELFLRMNAPHLRPYDAPVVTFSHFVPRPELVPPVEFLRFKGLPRVAGSQGIERQLRALGARVHVYGHTHIRGDRVIGGVRYVQSWLGKPAEGRPVPLAQVWTAGEPEPMGAPPLFC